MERYHAASVLSLTVRHPGRGRRTLGTGCNGAPPDPTQLPAKKRILCDRHHIASAMAELVSYLSIVPHMRSFDVPPKHSARSRGAFFWCAEY